MKWIRKIAKWVLLLIIGIVVMFLLNIAWHRLRGPSEQERAALAVVEAPVAKPEGRNAFALAWLFTKNVPDADIERLAARDVEYANAHLTLNSEELRFPSEALPDLVQPDSGSAALCATTPGDCLATVRDDQESVRALLAEHAVLLQRAESMEKFEYLYNEFPRVISMPLSYSGFGLLSQRLRSSQLALMFEDGNRDQAVAGVCRNIGMWRRFGSDNRSLFQTMLAGKQRDLAITLFADMLAELDSGVPLPAQCSTALSPVVAKDVSLCSSMLGEFAYTDALFSTMTASDISGQEKSWLDTGAQPILLDPSRTRAWDAKDKVRYCAPELDAQALLDRPPELPPLDIDWFDCQANKIGCILTQVATPAMNEYELRLLDSAAHLRLAATLAWLHETSGNGQSLQTRFDSRPETLRSGTRATGIADDGRSIWVDNLYTKRAERFSLPLGTNGEPAP